MGRCRVVQPDTVRLPLSEGDFIDVIRDLNAGEYHDLIDDLIDRKSFAKILRYVIGWSLVGLDGKPIPYSFDLPESVRRDTVRALDKATVKELNAVLDRHEKAEEAAFDAKKKATTGPVAVPGSSAT